MGNIGYFARDERTARSRAAKLVHREAFIYGSIVTSKRKCGKKSCRCHREGEEGHLSSYLSVKVGGRRKMIFIPQKMLKKAREWIKAYKGLEGDILKISESCVDHLKRE
jgi:hypothetical protein